MRIHNYKKDGVQRCYRIYEYKHPKSNVQLVLKCLDGNQLLDDDVLELDLSVMSAQCLTCIWLLYSCCC